jgi:hypothetical protein
MSETIWEISELEVLRDETDLPPKNIEKQIQMNFI